MFTSSFETADDRENLSVKYTNLYSIDGELCYLTTDKDVVLPYVNKFTNVYSWRPSVKIFEKEEDINKYAKATNLEVVNLALLGDNLWYGNVGHALFDGFYPIYLAALKFGYENEPFIYLADNWANPKVVVNDGIVAFSKSNASIGSYPKLDKSKIILFKTLISGSGRTGNRVINEEYTLYGKKYNGLEKFKKRMLECCGAVPDKPLNKTLKTIIIDNKRYSSEERKILNLIVNHLKTNFRMEVEWVDWSKYVSFKEQMKVIQDVDIHITGPGTGMMYMPFLKKGAININLGYMEHTQTNGARSNIKILQSTKPDHVFPGWMEQSVCAGADYVTTLYYDRFSYNNIEIIPLLNLIKKAVGIINNEEPRPSNHNIDAQVFIEYCKRASNARQLCDYLTGIAFFIELFVHEHPAAIPESLVNIELLREVKKELGFDTTYEIKF